MFEILKNLLVEWKDRRLLKDKVSWGDFDIGVTLTPCGYMPNTCPAM